MKRALVMLVPLAAALSGCFGAEAADGRLECVAIEDCPGGQVCFYGVCVAPGYSISSVYAELTPPNDSSLLAQQYPWPLELADGFQELAVRKSVTLAGKVLREDGPAVPGTLHARSPGVIPGLAVEYRARVTEAGFSLAVVPGTYELTLEPDDPGLPPRRYADVLLDGDVDTDLAYPALDDLVTVSGEVRFSASVAMGPTGARVWGTAEDLSGEPLRSTVATTDQGAFALTFPPGARLFTINVGPGQGSVDGERVVPEASFPGLEIVEAPDRLPLVVLGVEQDSVTAVVLDNEDRPVAQASVLFEGTVGTTEARFTALSSTNAQGVVADEPVFRGRYLVTAAPGPGEYALQTTEVEIPGDAVVIRLRPKVKLTGVVTAADGRAVSGAPLLFTLRGASIPRQYPASTDAAGRYAVEVDPGTASQPAEYEITVSPTPDTGLPFYRGIIRVGEVDMRHDVRLYDATLVYGAVTAPSGAPMSNLLVAFHSQDLAAPSEPGGPARAVLVGVVQTREDGSFVFPVPKVPPGDHDAP